MKNTKKRCCLCGRKTSVGNYSWTGLCAPREIGNNALNIYFCKEHQRKADDLFDYFNRQNLFSQELNYTEGKTAYGEKARLINLLAKCPWLMFFL